MKAKSLIFVLLGMLGTAANSGHAGPADLSAVTARCESCHDNNNPMIPRLEGQPAQYLASRIRSFADLTIQGPHSDVMFDTNAGLSDAMVIALAKYFAAKPGVEAASSSPLVATGEHLYRFGDRAGVTACQTCHGSRGEGEGAVARLAGQRSVYLRAQLEDFSMFTRVHDAMNERASKMSEDQINALVAFLSRD